MNESQVADAFTRDDCLRRRVGSKPARQAVTTAWILAAFAAHPIAAEVRNNFV